MPMRYVGEAGTVRECGSVKIRNILMFSCFFYSLFSKYFFCHTYHKNYEYKQIQRKQLY